MMREIKFRAWDDNYKVGSDGSVYSRYSGIWRKINNYPDKDSYLYVQLIVNKKRVKKMVHRLVAELFLKQPSPKYQVNHKNGIRHDNRLTNLEWVTAKENVIHSYRVLGKSMDFKNRELAKKRFIGSKNPKAKLNETQVTEIRKLRLSGSNLRTIVDLYSVSRSQISAICTGRNWK